MHRWAPRPELRRWAASAVVAVMGLAGGLSACGSGHRAAPGTRTAAPVRTVRTPAPRLTGTHRCPPPTGAFACSTLAVPLDRAAPAGARLRLAVAVERRRSPRGVLIALSGGPGQPGLPFAARLRARLGAAAAGYRIVTIDQRGTGANALQCPELQRAAGSSDLTVPRRAAVTACARALGARRAFFTTADTVADLDDLRRALGVDRVTLDGVSYGTFVAERYALAHPREVARLVLDSVVPQDGVDALYADALAATSRVLRLVCREQRCATDPVADLRRVVRRRHDGPALLDTLVALSIGRPRLSGVPAVLHAAAAGLPAALDRLVRQVHGAQRVPAAFLSQGLHAATLCADLRAPWGGPDAPPAAREPALRRAAARLTPGELGGFDRATASGNGIASTCAAWPPIPRPALDPGGPLPRVPVLLLAGDHDLSTPLAWARRQRRRAPLGRLVVIPGAGHAVQSQTGNAQAMRALTRFLTG